ncbi:MAG TPA: adenine phosphoribosyltransferase [Candidatus Xenobia bacterium]
MTEEQLKKIVRDVPDFPRPGILFKDITPLLAHPAAFETCIDALAEKYQDANLSAIAAVEARGYLVGAPLAYKMGVSLVPVRKPGKLPYETISQKYELEYGSNTLEIHKDAVKAGQRVLVVDDLIATGGSARATGDLLSRLGAHVVGYAFLIELTFLNGRDTLQGFDVFSLMRY